VLPAFATNEDPLLFRIGTGGEGGTYFPIGKLLARVMSGMVGGCTADDCNSVAPLVVVQVSNGSVANVENMAAGLLEAGLVQADVAHWAYGGTEIFSQRDAVTELRAVASLYAESVHLVVRGGSGIHSVADLRGKRVSLDEPGSGTLVDARVILAAYGLHEGDIGCRHLKPSFAAEKLSSGELDAYFIVAGYPTRSVEQALAAGARLVPIDGPTLETLVGDYPFFSRGVIPAEIYAGSGPTKTLTVGAQLLVTVSASDELIYRMTRAIWADSARAVLDSGHPKGGEIRLQTALSGLAIPLHPGARRFYLESQPAALALFEDGR
jgi:hypothetical protein